MWASAEVPVKRNPINMPLHKVVEACSDDDILYIGADTGWFFIGPKKEYHKDIKDIQENWISLLKLRLENDEEILSYIAATIKAAPNRIKRYEEAKASSINKAVDDLCDYMNNPNDNKLEKAISSCKRATRDMHNVKAERQMFRNAKARKRYIERHRKRLEASLEEPLYEDRTILDIFRSDIDDCGIKIKIRGTGEGRYWFREEYINKKPERQTNTVNPETLDYVSTFN